MSVGCFCEIRCSVAAGHVESESWGGGEIIKDHLDHAMSSPPLFNSSGGRDERRNRNVPNPPRLPRPLDSVSSPLRPPSCT
jgi:hypothetical protein